MTRSVCSINTEMVAHVSRIVGGANDAERATEVWESWSGNARRSVALLVDKIYSGWLDSVGPIAGWPSDPAGSFSSLATTITENWRMHST